MLETCRRQNCERGTHTGSPSGLSDRAKHGETDNKIDPHMPLGACGPVKEFQLRVTTVQVPSRTGHPPAVYDTLLSSPAHVRSLKLQKHESMREHDKQRAIMSKRNQTTGCKKRQMCKPR